MNERWSITFSCDDAGNIHFSTSTEAVNVSVGEVLQGILMCCAGDLATQARHGLVIDNGLDIELPPGWEATGDGVATRVVIGQGASYCRDYKKGDLTIEAPCREDGTASLKTIQALVAA